VTYLGALSAYRASASTTARDPTAAMLWSPWQRDVLADVARFLAVRAANQVGKTTLAAAMLIMEARETNPFRAARHEGPKNLMLMSESYEQMAREGGVLEKLWEMLPKDEIDPRIRFVRGRGLVGTKYPAITFIRGPGAGTVIRLARYEQRAKNLAGATLHGIVLDEPCPSKIYSEALPRLRHHHGWMLVTFTPAPDMPDQRYMQELIKKGVFREYHVELTEAACWPVGCVRPFQTQAQIEEFEAGLERHQADLRVRALWDSIIEDRYLTAWDDHRHVRAFTLGEIAKDALLVVGIDHGIGAGKQVASLVAVSFDSQRRPVVHVIDECWSDGKTETVEDARAIIAMLARNGLSYEHIDRWVGDRSTQDVMALRRKSNAKLQRAILHQLAIDATDERAKSIRVPKKWDGSVDYTFGLMNEAMAGARFTVHSRCGRFIEAASTWRGDRAAALKDALDPVRYAVQEAARGVGRSARALVAGY